MIDSELALPPADELAGLRLIATDMDGTLLDAEHRVDPAFWDLVAAFSARGIEVCAASGRQLGALEVVLGDHLSQLTVIADNGAIVLRHGVELHSAPVDHGLVVDFTHRMRALAAQGHRVVATVSGRSTAYLEGPDPEVLDEALRYFPHGRVVEDLTAVQDEAFKVSAYDVAPIGEAVLPAVTDYADRYAILQGHAHWVDINAAGTDKGAALRLLQATLGVGREHTAAFGDQPNDLELLRAAGMSWAMANAHPDTRAVARFGAPANTDAGVVRILSAILAILG